MVTNLILKRNQYYCLNCMMRQPSNPLPTHCVFCGKEFSDWEQWTYKQIVEKERNENESKIYGRN